MLDKESLSWQAWVHWGGIEMYFPYFYEYCVIMERIDELKEPPIIGKKYLVPCIIESSGKYYSTDESVYYGTKTKPIMYVYPIINHPHTDFESGQYYIHYHVDYRFVHMKGLIPVNKDKRYEFAPNIRFNLVDEEYSRFALGWNKSPRIEYHPLRCIRLNNLGIAGDVSRAKMKHQCIHKGKCPHRGYDLSQEVAINGIITCPLHGLEFDALTKKIIK